MSLNIMIGIDFDTIYRAVLPFPFQTPKPKQYNNLEMTNEKVCKGSFNEFFY